MGSMPKIIYLVIFCVCVPFAGCDETNKPVARVEEKSMDTLRVDKTKLSPGEQRYINFVDSMVTDLDTKTQLVARADTVISIEGLTSKLHCRGFAFNKRNPIRKIISAAVNSKQNIIYTFYYSDARIVKINTEFRDPPPFYASIYYTADSAILPEHLYLNSAEASKTLSIQLQSFLNKRR
jgi:hypothetical protein